MKVCVTGGNGFIGSVVVRLLITNGHTVRCMLRKTSDTARIAGLNYERVKVHNVSGQDLSQLHLM